MCRREDLFPPFHFAITINFLLLVNFKRFSKKLLQNISSRQQGVFSNFLQKTVTNNCLPPTEHILKFLKKNCYKELPAARRAYFQIFFSKNQYHEFCVDCRAYFHLFFLKITKIKFLSLVSFKIFSKKLLQNIFYRQQVVFSNFLQKTLTNNCLPPTEHILKFLQKNCYKELPAARRAYFQIFFLKKTPAKNF